MKSSKKFLLFVAMAAITFANAACAGSLGSMTIISPKEGAVLQGSGNKLEYTVDLSPNGHHLHIYVDNQDPIIGRKVSGCPCSVDLPVLAPGKHVIAVKEATAGHSLTGLQGSVTFTVK
jgi:hypothetical protein